MTVQLVSYDLHAPGQDYTELYEAIKALGPWCHCLESVWLVKTDFGSRYVRDVLADHIDANDSLLVAELAGDWATIGIDSVRTEWLHSCSV